MPASKSTSPDGYGSIRADEVLPLREAARRLGWARKTVAHAQRDGLRTVAFGRMKYVLGEDVIAFFRQQQVDVAEPEDT